MAKIYGATLITDCKPLEQLLTDIAAEGDLVRAFEDRFPRFRSAAIECLKDLTMRGLNYLGEDKTVVTSTLIYLNHRVQAWAGQGVDEMPSLSIMVDPDVCGVRWWSTPESNRDGRNA